MKSNIPLIVAVTGHRDLIKEDEPILRSRVKEFFSELKQNNAHTDILLLCGLAEGADMLVAEVALELGVELMAVLPYEKDKYLQSFEDTTQIERFNKLYSKAKYVKVLEKTNEGAYVELAKYLAKHSNILLALWDGDRSNINPGGTADVVQRKEKGYEVENKLDINEEDIIIHIITPREKNPNIKDAYKIVKIFIGRTKEEDYKNILKHIDNLNSFLSKEADIKEGSIVTTLQKSFSNRANRFQKRYNFNSIFMLVLAFLVVLSMEIVHNFGRDYKILEHIFVGVYFGIILFMFAFYYAYLKNANLKNHFVHSRGLSEALRVQEFWFCVDKNPQRVGDYYLLGESSELVWIRAVLKNIYFFQALKSDIAIDFECVKKDWINGQVEYFKSKINQRKRRLKRLELLEKVLYFTGAIFTVWLLVDYAMHHFEHLRHSILFASGISFAAAAFIGEKYLPMTGLEEEIHNFELMKYSFEVALDMLNKVNNQKEQKQIIYDLGEKALQENSRWLVYHSKYKIKPIVE